MKTTLNNFLLLVVIVWRIRHLISVSTNYAMRQRLWFPEKKCEKLSLMSTLGQPRKNGGFKSKKWRSSGFPWYTIFFSKERGASLGPTDFFAIESSDFRWGRKQAIRSRALNHVYPILSMYGIFTYIHGECRKICNTWMLWVQIQNSQIKS